MKTPEQLELIEDEKLPFFHPRELSKMVMNHPEKWLILKSIIHNFLNEDHERFQNTINRTVDANYEFNVERELEIRVMS